MRAGAADAGSAALAAEIAVLRAEWRDIAVRAEAAAPPACLRAADPVLRIIETFAAADPQRIILADAGAAHAAAAVTRRLYPALAARIEASREQGALFDRHDVADALASAESRRVPLPAGGSIAVEPTEALIAIDVDTGAVAGARAALRTNLEAATEAARQLRLRDIGGLVAIDFIRLADGAARQRVLEALRRATADDRVAVQVLGWTHGGLVELIRPRARRAETVD
ncbi:MAG: ribonuclease E/G [Rhodospirillales bacterium]|nr:ribonuclease E/G [Rhodospirillales bacterium]